MAFFLLVQDGTTSTPLANLMPRFSSVGLQPLHHVLIQGWHLWLFGQFNAKTLPLFQTTDGELAAATGWFVFDGLTGLSALQRCLESFDGQTLDQRRCQGHFNLILRKANQWFLLCDGLDAGKIYYNTSETWFSNSFYAVLAGIRHPEPDIQGCYEYAFNGTQFGEKSFVRQIQTKPAGTMTVINAQVTHRLLPEIMPWDTQFIPRSCEETAQLHLNRLKELFRLYANVFGNRLRTAISGGYDSRLILALLLDAGIQPELFIYGPQQGDPEVAVAQTVAKAAGLPLEIIDKTQHQNLPPDRHKAHIERNCIAFDGWKLAGLFDGGVDMEDRLKRSQNRVLMNGSAGEIYRNFYYLPNRPLNLQSVIWSFYSRYRPQELTAAFSPQNYADSMLADLRRALGAPSDHSPLPRGWTERSYPLFRGRFWTARDLDINLRFGPTLFPFLEAEIVHDTWHIPLACKQYGQLEARMIQLAWPALAACRSIYGHSFSHRPPWHYRLSMQATLLRPITLRGYTYRIGYRHPHPRPFFLTPEWLGRVLDLSFPYMRPLFQVDNIHDPEVYNRVATMEYLFQNGGS